MLAGVLRETLYFSLQSVCVGHMIIVEDVRLKGCSLAVADFAMRPCRVWHGRLRAVPTAAHLSDR